MLQVQVLFFILFYFINFPIFQIEFTNSTIFTISTNDFPVFVKKCLHFPPKTVIFSPP